MDLFNTREYQQSAGVMHGEAAHERGESIFEDLQSRDDESSSASRRLRLDALSLDRRSEQESSQMIELSKHERCHMLKRTRSLDSGRFAKAVTVKLAFKDDLYLV